MPPRLALGLLGLLSFACDGGDPPAECAADVDCAAGELCVDATCQPREACAPGTSRACSCDPGAGEQTCAAGGEAYRPCECAPEPDGGRRDAAMDAAVAPGTDAGPVDCGGVTAAGWELCEASRDACSFVFSDSTGCPAACARLGLVCGESFEDVDGMCAADTARPALACADTGHISDYCTCVRGASTADAGVDAGAPDAGVGSCPPSRPWECLLDELVGFGGAATGGAGGDLCWVDNLSASGAGSLRACLDAPAPRWIVFRVSGAIELGSVTIPPDTTIDGRGQRVTLRGGSGHLISIGDANVVLSHLFLEGAEYDLVHTWPTSRDVWLHHLTLTTAGDELLGLDGPRATVSWTHFRDNNYATLIGGGARDYPDLFVTLHHDLFTGNSERHPRTRGRIHSFNNVIDYGLSGGRASSGGQILSERNRYTASRGSGSALISRAGGAVTVPGHYRSVDDVLLGGATLSTPNDPSPVFTPTYPYALDAADGALEARVRAEAGWFDEPLPMP